MERARPKKKKPLGQVTQPSATVETVAAVEAESSVSLEQRSSESSQSYSPPVVASAPPLVDEDEEEPFQKELGEVHLADLPLIRALVGQGDENGEVTQQSDVSVYPQLADVLASETTVTMPLLPRVAEYALLDPASLGEDPFGALIERYRRCCVQHKEAQNYRMKLLKRVEELEAACWIQEIRYVTETRLCGDGASFNERHELIEAKFVARRGQDLKECMARLAEHDFRTRTQQDFESAMAYENCRDFLLHYFADSGLSERLEPTAPVTLWISRQGDGASAGLRHFGALLLLAASDPLGIEAGSEFLNGVTELLKAVMGPLARIQTGEDALFVCRSVMAAPFAAGWASFCVQVSIECLQSLESVTVVMQVLRAVMRDGIVDISERVMEETQQEDEEKEGSDITDAWVMLRESGRAPPALRQSEDDLEAIFNQVPLAAAHEWALQNLGSNCEALLQVSNFALEELLEGCYRYSFLPHFARVLGHAATVGILGACGNSMSAEDGLDKLCERAVLSLVKLPVPLWAFLRDVPYTQCSEACVWTLLSHLCAACGATTDAAASALKQRNEEFICTAATVIGVWVDKQRDSLQAATMVLTAIERMAAGQSGLDYTAVCLIERIGLREPGSAIVGHKIALSLLASLCSSNVALISVLLERLGGPESEKRWAGLVFLSRELPLERWVPSEGDFARLRYALMQAPDSEASKAARAMLSRVVGGRNIALLALEVMTHHDGQYVKQKSWFGASQRTSPPAVELYEWLWELAARAQLFDPVSGVPMEEPMDLSSPKCAALRAALREVPDSDLDGGAGDARALASWLAVGLVRLQQSTLPALLSRLAAAPNPTVQTSEAYFRALVTAAPLMASGRANIAAVVEPLGAMLSKATGQGSGFFRDPFGTLVGRSGGVGGSSDSTVLHQSGSPGRAWLLELVPVQMRRAGLAGWWTALLTSLPAWRRQGLVRRTLNAGLKEAISAGCWTECVNAMDGGTGDLPSLSPSGESMLGSIVSPLLGTGAGERRERLGQWGAQYSYLLATLLIRDARDQAGAWRAIGREGSAASLPSLKSATPTTEWAIVLFAAACERLPWDSEAGPILWQLFFLLYFERSPVGKCWAANVLQARDAALTTRLATALEIASASCTANRRPHAATYNAWALWLRYEGHPHALADSWAALPASYCGPSMLRRVATEGKSLGVDEPDSVVWRNLLPLDSTAALSESPAAAPPPSLGAGGRRRSSIGGAGSSVRGRRADHQSDAVGPASLDALAEASQLAADGSAWAQTVPGLRAGAEGEIEKLERRTREWADGLALTTALQAELLEEIGRKYRNDDDVRVVNKHCSKGPLQCLRAAQFVFRGTKIVLDRRTAERLAQLQAQLTAAVPEEGAGGEVAGALRGLARAGARFWLIDQGELSLQLLWRLADIAGAAFPPLLGSEAQSLYGQLAGESSADLAEELLSLILARPERATVLLPLLKPSGPGFGEQYLRVADGELSGERLRLRMLGRFSTEQWVSDGADEASVAAFLAQVVKRASQGGSPADVHVDVARALVRAHFPRHVESTVKLLVAIEAQQGHGHARWEILLDEGRLMERIADVGLAERITSLVESHLWALRGLKTPPRSLPLLPLRGAALGEWIRVLPMCAAFAGPSASQSYGLLRPPPDPLAAWAMMERLLLPYVTTLSVTGLKPLPRLDTLYWAPWLTSEADSAAAGQFLARNVPILNLVERHAPLMLEAWALLAALLPNNPEHVQRELCTVFSNIPWHRLEGGSTGLFCKSLYIVASAANFPSFTLQTFLASVFSVLPLFSGAESPENGDAAADAFLALAELLLSFPSTDALFGLEDADAGSAAGVPCALRLVLDRGLVEWNSNLSEADRYAWLQRACLWVTATCEQSVESRRMVDPQVSAVLQLLEPRSSVATREEDWVWTSVIIERLLPCPHISRALLQPLVERALERALQRGEEDNTGVARLLRLHNHPEAAFQPGIDIAVQAVLARKPNLALRVLQLACANVGQPEKLATAAEVCCEAHFSVSGDWVGLLAALAPPELERVEFERACVRDQSVLVLCAMAARKPALAVTWSGAMHVTAGMAWKMPLLWGLALVSGELQADALKALQQQWAEMGRDTNSHAVLSMLGFGERSPFSVEFRLFCRLFYCLMSRPAADPKELRSIALALPSLEPVTAWIDKRQASSRALEFVAMAGNLLFPKSKCWNL